MDIGNILNTKGGAAAAAAAAAEAQLRQQLEHQLNASSSSDLSSDQASIPAQQQTMHQMHLPNGMTYQPPRHHVLPMLPNGYMPGPVQDDGYTQAAESESNRAILDSTPKAFACSTCAKGFARRSDLARHERIHSGVRPHVCDWPGCGKQFIQRSALTVHARVHTGEKPHMCERCGKPFSDSSSLARHRRIHSGKRPYKCPYANCQKTFTRRTTLTRHQNHHTGTIEEAAAETNAKLQTTKNPSFKHEPSSMSETASLSHSTPSPSERPNSMSPATDLPPIPHLHRQHSDFSYLPPNGSLPPHLRHDFQQHPPRSSTTNLSTSLNANYNPGGMLIRPSITSHPPGYGPPQPLEPPAISDNRSTGSASASPHLTAMGWGSPTHASLPSPSLVLDASNYAYPDPTYGGGHLYYPGSNIRRPQSTEPENYELRPRAAAAAVGHLGMISHMNHHHHQQQHQHHHHHVVHPHAHMAGGGMNLPVGGVEWGGMNVNIGMQSMH